MGWRPSGAGGVQPIDPFAHPMTDSGDAIAAPDAEILHA
jgi:hypothetical protein